MRGEPQIGVIESRSDPSWHHRIALLRPLTGRRVSVCYILGVKPYSQHYILCIYVSFGRDTKCRWSLLSGVYARGRKISHTGRKCVTYRGLHILA